MRSLFTVVALLAVLWIAPLTEGQQTTSAVVPTLINYSGTLHRPGGIVASTRTAGMTFSIYRQQESGAPLWVETQSVTCDATGHYSVVLGSTKAEGIPIELFSEKEERWLGVKVEGQAEQPRVMLVSVPYALKAHDAETLGGRPASAYALAKPQPTGLLGESLSSGGADASVAGLGHGKKGTIPLWLSPTYLGISALSQTGNDVTAAGKLTARAFVGDGSQLTLSLSSICATLASTSSAATLVQIGCGKVVFVSAGAFSGNLGGVDGADAKCQAEAVNKQLPGTYRAWISDNLGNSPSTRFNQSVFPYYLLDANRTIVAANYAGLGSTIANAINVNSSGQTVSVLVWTNTNPGGLSANDADCNNWTSVNGFGLAGLSTNTNAGWTRLDLNSCSASFPNNLYCFQQ